MSDWPMVKFYELAADDKSAFSKPYGSAITKEDYVPEGVPVVRGVNLRKGIFVDDEFVFINDDAASRMPGANLIAGDLVFTHRGTIGQVSMIPRNPRHSRYVLSTSQVKARLDPSRAIPEFYYYWFSSPDGQHELRRNISTVGVPGLGQPVATIKSLRVPYPPRPVQEAVADVLRALDEKIAANERIYATIRELMAAHYEISIRESAIIEPLGDAARFHNHLREPLSSRQRADFKGSFPYYGATGIIDHVAGYRFDGDYVLVGEDGSVTTSEGYPIVQHPSEKFWVSNHAHALTGFRISNVILEMALSRADVRPFITGAVQPKLSMGNLKKLMLILPNAREEQQLDQKLEVFSQCGRTRTAESLALSRLRDSLLPRLMSREIRVRDAEAIVGR